MNLTPDFQKGCDILEPEGPQEVYALFTAAKNRSPFGIYDVKPATGCDRWIVSALGSDEGLLLVSSKALDAFLSHLTRTYCGGDLDMESWFSFEHAMAKDD
jgi:hypothetical protein